MAGYGGNHSRRPGDFMITKSRAKIISALSKARKPMNLSELTAYSGATFGSVRQSMIGLHTLNMVVRHGKSRYSWNSSYVPPIEGCLFNLKNPTQHGVHTADDLTGNVIAAIPSLKRWSEEYGKGVVLTLCGLRDIPDSVIADIRKIVDTIGVENVSKLLKCL